MSGPGASGSTPVRLRSMPTTPARAGSSPSREHRRLSRAEVRVLRARVPARRRSRSSSRRRPTSRVEGFRSTSTPNNERAETASQTPIGSCFPFAATDSRSRYSMGPSVARYVFSPTRIPLTGAAVCRRAAVLITSPATSPSPASARASMLTRASPVFTASRTSTASSSSAQSRIANAERTARSASSSCTRGAPKTATTASPMNFSTVPP